MRTLFWSTAGILFLGLIGYALVSVSRSNAEMELAEKLAELEAAGIPVTLDEINRRYHEHGRDPAGNAEPVYQRAFAAQVSEGLSIQEIAEALQRAGRHLSISAAEMEAMAEGVAGNEETLRLLHEAVKYPYVRFDIDFRDGAELLLLHVSRMRNGARILAAQAIVDAESGNREGAAEAISAIFRMAVHLSEEPGMISQLSRIAIEDFGRIALEQALARVEFSSETLTRLQADVRAAELAPRMIPAFETELANTEWYFKQIEEAGTLGDDITGPWKRTVFFFYRASGKLIRDQRVFLTRMEEVLRQVKLPHAERLQVNWEGTMEVSVESTVGELLADIMIPSMGRVLDADSVSVTYLRAARIAIAAERYRLENGDFPSDPRDLVPTFLDELPGDPYATDGAFAFVVEDEAFHVRSNGTVERRDHDGEMSIQFVLPVTR